MPCFNCTLHRSNADLIYSTDDEVDGNHGLRNQFSMALASQALTRTFQSCGPTVTHLLRARCASVNSVIADSLHSQVPVICIVLSRFLGRAHELLKHAWSFPFNFRFGGSDPNGIFFPVILWWML
jgi:hypothetical protein